ncbi:MAG TPA: IS5 family transposase [Candidatus Nanoarchaeia archaeon]|nr:IS5 family transposase [Candidatus Nanoarchaeia archaeon]
MTKNKRKKYRDKRNWKEYNQKLVKRGEFYINPQFLETWNKETKQMNAGKVGQPYFYPKSEIEFLAVLHAKNFDYRALEGIIQSISNNHRYQFPVISYSQICRRINTLKVDFECVKENLLVAIDGSGEKVSNRGEWMRQKWKVRRGWIKVVIMGTTDGKIVDIRVGNENLDERKVARGMIRKNHKKIDKTIMDGLHDCRDTFNLCEKYGIETAIKIRKNASKKAKGSPRRKKEVIEYKKLGHDEWSKEKEYGLRWPASEGIFSSDKRIFGESVRATKKRNMYKEVRMKFWAYNKLLEIVDS